MAFGKSGRKIFITWYANQTFYEVWLCLFDHFLIAQGGGEIGNFPDLRFFFLVKSSHLLEIDEPFVLHVRSGGLAADQMQSND